MHWFLPRTKEDLRRAPRVPRASSFAHWARARCSPARRRACCRSSTRCTRTRSRGSRIHVPRRAPAGAEHPRQVGYLKRTTSRSRRCSSTSSTTVGRDDAWPRRRCCAWSTRTTRGSSCAGGRRSARRGVRQRVLIGNLWGPGRRAEQTSTRWCPANDPASRTSCAQSLADARRRPVRPAAGQPRRRARRDGLLRRRAHPVGPRVPHRQPRAREVLPAAPVRLDARRDPDPPRASTPR